MAFLQSAWRDMEHFHTPHSTEGCKISTSGVRWCSMAYIHVDDVLFDAAFRPNESNDTFLQVPLERERTGGMFLRRSFPGIGLYNPRLGLALVLS